MFDLAATIASGVIEATIRGSIALVIAAMIVLLFRRRASAQSFVWHLAFAGVLALTVLSPALPSWAPPLPERLLRVERIADALTPTWLSDEIERAETRSVSPAGRARDASTAIVTASRGWREVAMLVAVLVWFAGMAWRVTKGAFESAWLRRVEQGANGVSELSPGDGTLALAVTRGLKVMETSAAVVPIIWGFRRYRLLLPVEWRRWPAPVIDAVVRHEIAHIDRHDLLAKLCVEVVGSVFWFNPIVWFAAHRAHIAREQACDDRALRRDIAPDQYAEALVLLARLLRDSALRPRFVLAFGKSPELTARVHALLDGRRSRSALRRRDVLLGGLAGLTMLTPIGVVRIAEPRAMRTLSPPTREVVVGAVGRALDSAFTPIASAGFSGVILVARHDSIVFRKAFGIANRTRNVPMTVSTRFQAAGIMKAFTAAAVVDLADRGVISLNAPVARYLPDVSGPARAVSLRQLLLHTDGLKDVRHLTTSRSQFLHEMGRSAVAFPAGTSYGSTDVGHSLLAAVVEQVVSRPFDEFIQERFLDAAGLSSSSVGRLGWQRAGTVAAGYGEGQLERVPKPDDYEWGVRGSRGLLTTVDDLLKWFGALSSGDVITPNATRQLFTTHHMTSKRFGQSFGWLLYDSTSVGPARSAPIPGRRRSGREVGFESELVHNPAGGWTAIILANTDVNSWRTRALDVVGTVMATRDSN